MEQQELQYWVAWSCVSAVGPSRFYKILDQFHSLQHAWNAVRHESALTSLGINQKSASLIMEEKNAIDPKRSLEEMFKEQVQAVTVHDAEYPHLLKHIFEPPPVLFYRGDIHNAKPKIAVVGTRKYSNYGKSVTSELSGQLARWGLNIVSGLAFGIDAIAHASALEAKGTTWAVLGCGIDKNSVYPSSNRALAERILESGGALLSEHPIGTPPLKHHFPQRNRIISGLSLGTIVTEAPLRSGALITAYFSLEQNREVLAVPGPIYSINSQGTNKLIKMGAKTVTSPEDVIEALALPIPKKTAQANTDISLTPDESHILNIISAEPMHIDSIIRESGLSSAKIHTLLTLLELNGLIKNIGGGMYKKI